MSDSRSAYLKGQFAQLVKLVGGVDAAGAYLGVSAERVSQLQRSTCADLPSVLQIWDLQDACGNPIVTDAISARTAGVQASRDLQKETREHLHAAANLDALAASNAPPKAISDALTKAQRELADVAHVLAANE